MQSIEGFHYCIKFHWTVCHMSSQGHIIQCLQQLTLSKSVLCARWCGKYFPGTVSFHARKSCLSCALWSFSHPGRRMRTGRKRGSRELTSCLDLMPFVLSQTPHGDLDFSLWASHLEFLCPWTLGHRLSMVLMLPVLLVPQVQREFLAEPCPAESH